MDTQGKKKKTRFSCFILKYLSTHHLLDIITPNTMQIQRLWKYESLGLFFQTFLKVLQEFTEPIIYTLLS